jgi:hypothetical protein
MEATIILKRVLVFQRVVVEYFSGVGTLLVVLETMGLPPTT